MFPWHVTCKDTFWKDKKENVSLGVFHDTRQLLSPSTMIRMFACFSPGKGREKEKMWTPGTLLISGKLCVRKLVYNTSKSWRNIAFFRDIKCNWFLRMPFLGLPPDPCKNLWYFSFISLICVGFGYCLMVSWPFLLSLFNVIILEFDKLLHRGWAPLFYNSLQLHALLASSTGTIIQL